jgi:hypothetical protein
LSAVVVAASRHAGERSGGGKRIFEIKIELQDVRPMVVRHVEVPAAMTLAGLQEVVRWRWGGDSHLNAFDIAGTRCAVMY